MKINWKVRLKNKVWLAGAAAAVLTFVYRMLALLDIAPAVTQDTAAQAVEAALLVLTALGVVVDPTTAGVGDSEQALEYEEPKG